MNRLTHSRGLQAPGSRLRAWNSLVSLDKVHRDIVSCNRCTRLRDYCAEIARVKRAAFKGEAGPLQTVLDARPDVLNHNTETVPRLYRAVRSGGRYTRTLELLARSRHYAPAIPTKTGMMMGLGEEQDEVVQVFKELRDVGVSILTLGQYLRPSENHAVMTRYYHPDEFRELKRIALGMGFAHVEAGPLVRSSYHAHEQADAADAALAR